MAKKSFSNGKSTKPNCQKISKEKPVIIIRPQIVDHEIDEQKLSELHSLIAKVITLGWKKGRPSKSDLEEFNYAA